MQRCTWAELKSMLNLRQFEQHGCTRQVLGTRVALGGCSSCPQGISQPRTSDEVTHMCTKTYAHAEIFQDVRYQEDRSGVIRHLFSLQIPPTPFTFLLTPANAAASYRIVDALAGSLCNATATCAWWPRNLVAPTCAMKTEKAAFKSAVTRMFHLRVFSCYNST